MMVTRNEPGRRMAKRLNTRQRVFDAALSEFQRHGVASADVSAIAAAADVSRGSFYFHFPTKGHVIIELTRRLEQQVAADLDDALAETVELKAALAELIRRVVAEETRLGPVLFREMLNLYFSAPQTSFTDSLEHPITRVVIEQIEKARDRGEVYAAVESLYSAAFFLIGFYGLLVTNQELAPARTLILDKYLSSFCRGLEAR
jgi:AcrR family transcriptional regulator